MAERLVKANSSRDETSEKNRKPEPKPPQDEAPAVTPPKDVVPLPEVGSYDIPDMKEPITGGLGMVEITAVRDSDNEDDSLPGR